METSLVCFQSITERFREEWQPNEQARRLQLQGTYSKRFCSDGVIVLPCPLGYMVVYASVMMAMAVHFASCSNKPAARHPCKHKHTRVKTISTKAGSPVHRFERCRLRDGCSQQLCKPDDTISVHVCPAHKCAKNIKKPKPLELTY